MTNISRYIVLLLSIAILFAGGNAFAGEDKKGSKDHPLLKRMDGSWIYDYEFIEFTDYELVTATVSRDNIYPKPTETMELEGELTRILYAVPEARGTLEILRNYEQNFAQVGEVEELFSCNESKCVSGSMNMMMAKFLKYGDLSRTGQRTEFGQKVLDRVKDQRYWVGKLTTPDSAQYYVSLFVAVNDKNSSWEKGKGLARVPMALLSILKVKGMENTMITVEADEMAAEIGKTGHIALYGIYFDFDSDKLKPESDASLVEIAKLLKGDPGLKVHVVGHTDNKGSSEYNLGLSTRRAKSVIRALSGKHGISASRLSPFGNGFYAPVASNDTEEGRALNRRVELVKW